MPKFLHDLPDFKQLITAVSNKQGITPSLIEKDYWIMHCLWGLQAQGYCFELKGGTSLSKGYGVIQDRKIQRFRSGDEIVIAQNPAFVLERPNERQLFAQEFKKTKALYYQGQPDFKDVLERIQDSIHLM
jgi:hypothetical protein